MAKTEIHEWPLPETTATANVPQDMKNLADAMDRQVPFVCTKDTRPAPFAGLMIYETDTRRVWIGDGSKWMIQSQDWVKFTPQFRGWLSLGTSPTQEGQYCIGPGGVVTVMARLISGSGASMGVGRLSMYGLPLKSAGIWHTQSGEAILMSSGPAGAYRKAAYLLGNAANAGEFWIENGAAPFATPGASGVPWSNGSELHVRISYTSELGNSVI